MWLEGMIWSRKALLDLADLTKTRTNRGVELVREGLHLILGMKVYCQYKETYNKELCHFFGRNKKLNLSFFPPIGTFSILI